MADVEKIKRGYEQAVENLTRYRKAYGDDIYTMATDAAIQDGLAALTLPAPEKVREVELWKKMGYNTDPRSVIYRTGELTERDYDEAIEALQAAKTQMMPDGRNCAICTDGHQAMHCHHNPLLMIRKLIDATEGWRCFHCGAYFTDEGAAREHFGENESVRASCQAAQQPVKKLDKLNIHILLDTLAEAARGKPLDPETCEIIENIAKDYQHTDFTAYDVQSLYDCGAAQQPQPEGVTEDEAIRILDAAGYFKIVKQKGE
jgi:hypothetical protein